MRRIIVLKIYERTVDETLAIFADHFEKIPEARLTGKLVIVTPDAVRVRA